MLLENISDKQSRLQWIANAYKNWQFLIYILHWISNLTLFFDNCKLSELLGLGEIYSNSTFGAIAVILAHWGFYSSNLMESLWFYCCTLMHSPLLNLYDSKDRDLLFQEVLFPSIVIFLSSNRINEKLRRLLWLMDFGVWCWLSLRV